MKVTGETFSFHHKRKRAEEERYQKYLNFQAKRPLPSKDSGAVKRGHSSFVFPQLYLEKSKVCPRFTKIVFY